jgi:hypothetical protein
MGETYLQQIKFLSEFLQLHVSIKSRIMRWTELVARTAEGRDVYRVLVGKSEGNRSLGRPRGG